MAAGTLPFATPTTLEELWRNILYDLGSTASPTEMHGILMQFDLALASSIGASAVGSLAPTGALGVTFERPLVGIETTAISTGVRYMAAVYLPKNVTISNFNWLPGTTGDAGPTDQWMALYNGSRLCLAASADATSAAITASTVATYPVATIAAGAATSFVTTYAGLYYVGLMLATSNSPTLVTGTGITHVNAVPPIITGTSGSALTTPDVPGTTTAAAITATATTPYFWLT